MQQFIPFEDDWSALENLLPEDLVPYRIGMLGTVSGSPNFDFPTPTPFLVHARLGSASLFSSLGDE